MDIVEILKIGLPGLVFLLCLLSYKLLSKEQQKTDPSPVILQSIKHYMYVNILLAVLTVAAPLLESTYAPKNSVFSVNAELSGTNLDRGSAAVCSKARYGGRYILITDRTTNKMIQVYAMGILPCSNTELIALGKYDARQLGWSDVGGAIPVEVSAAEQGQKYILKQI